MFFAQSGRVLVGVILALVLPGFALTVAFPRGMLGFPERVTVSLGTSLAILVLGGVLLDWGPGGIQAIGWLALLGGTVLVTGVIALGRRAQDPAERLAPRYPLHERVSLRSMVLMVVSALVVTAAILVARDGALHQRHEPYTQLWMLPTERLALTAVQLGMQSGEPNTETYRLELTIGDTVVGVWPEIVLESGESWATSATLPGADAAEPWIEARLYRANHPTTVYRRATLWRGD